MNKELEEHIDQAIQGKWPEGKVKVDGHSFELRNLRSDNKLKDGETCYFRHSHKGKDDRVFFAISVDGQGGYSAKITRIQYRGVFASLLGTKSFAVETAGASDDPRAKAFVQIAQVINKMNIQKKIDGNWEAAAAKIIDLIGKKVAEASSRNQGRIRLAA